MSSDTRLSAEHRHQLEVQSAIHPEIISERGVRSITRGRELPNVFSPRQKRRAPGILFTAHRPNCETSYIFRPDEPDPKNPGHKYEQPSKHYGGPGNILDVHPSATHLTEQKSVPVVFTEGIKKADALASAARAAGIEALVVAVSGVWNWMSDGESIPDMFDIPVEGRRVTLCFDSDMLRNLMVQEAAKRLAGHLISRGAKVFITYLRDKLDGSKMGADDFFAAGGTFAELRLLTRPYNPADFATIRLTRDEQLRAGIEDLKRRFWAEEWKGMGGHTDRDIALKLIEGAERHGKVVEDGIRVVQSWGSLELGAKVSRRTLAKAISRLEERGFCYRDNEGRKPDKAGAFVLRANVNHKGEEKAREKETQDLQGYSPRGLHLRAPRLRWSSPAYKPRRGLVCGTRKVREGPPPEPRPAIKRLGKIRGAVLDVLYNAGGSATVQEIADILHRKRPRDIRRRILPMLEEAEIVVVDGDNISLADDWLERLEDARELGKEIESEDTARRRIEVRRKAYHHRHEVKPDAHWTNDPDVDGAIEDLRPADEGQEELEMPEPETNPAVAFVLDYVCRLGRIRQGLLEECWLDEGGHLTDLRQAVDTSGVRKERLPEHRNAVFLYPPPASRGAA